MFPGRVAFALQILGCVDAALRAHRVGTLDRDNGEQVNQSSHLRDLDDGRQPSQPATHDYDFRI
jgi:hypothetical protein